MRQNAASAHAANSSPHDERRQLLADRAQKKHDDAKRIGVIHDTTSFKGLRIPRTASAPDAATEHVFEVRMRQVLIQ